MLVYSRTNVKNYQNFTQSKTIKPQNEIIYSPDITSYYDFTYPALLFPNSEKFYYFKIVGQILIWYI